MLMNERQFPASQAQRLEDPERLVWLPPAEVLRALHLQAGQTVADVGAGTGYLSLPLAHKLGPKGKVYAVDAQDQMLEWIAAKIKRDGLTNVELVHADASATTLPAASCDLFLTANVWHELDDRGAVLAEAKRVLKPAGRIALLDWSPDVERVGGPPLEHRIASDDVVAELGAAGFRDAAAMRVGKYSWLVQADR
jgi:ubiquinone/menaquinone biosynthesis C-methylase UbiE